jgi:cytochrome P450
MDQDRSERVNPRRFRHQRIDEAFGASHWNAQNGKTSHLVTVSLHELTSPQVTAPAGVDFDGLHVPCGVRVAAPNHHIQRDPDVYPEAERYNAFRYAAPGGSRDTGAYLQQKQNSLSMPSDHFLAWGHGRHACPGRFFAAHLMKIMLAHVLVNYDVTAEGLRPEGLDRNEFPIPSVAATFKVTRR